MLDGTFEITMTPFDGLFIVKNKFANEENFFYDRDTFFRNGLTMAFVQDNESYSRKNVLRGLHVQIKKPQGKLIHVLEGKINDVVVDLRVGSKTYGRWHSEILSSSNCKSLYIPEGFAHGFCVLSDYAKIQYKVSNYWDPEDEIGIPWNDPYLNIDWKLGGNSPIIANKDLTYKKITDNKFFNKYILGE